MRRTAESTRGAGLKAPAGTVKYVVVGFEPFAG